MSVFLLESAASSPGFQQKLLKSDGRLGTNFFLNQKEEQRLTAPEELQIEKGRRDQLAPFAGFFVYYERGRREKGFGVVERIASKSGVFGLCPVVPLSSKATIGSRLDAPPYKVRLITNDELCELFSMVVLKRTHKFSDAVGLAKAALGRILINLREEVRQKGLKPSSPAQGEKSNVPQKTSKERLFQKLGSFSAQQLPPETKISKQRIKIRIDSDRLASSCAHPQANEQSQLELLYHATKAEEKKETTLKALEACLQKIQNKQRFSSLEAIDVIRFLEFLTEVDGKYNPEIVVTMLKALAGIVLDELFDVIWDSKKAEKIHELLIEASKLPECPRIMLSDKSCLGGNEDLEKYIWNPPEL